MAHPGDQHRVGSYVNQQKGKFEHGPSSASGSRENQTKNHDTKPANVAVEQRDHGKAYSETEDLHRSADGASAKNTTSAKETKSIFIRELFEGEEYHKMRYVFDAKPKKEDLKNVLSKHRYEPMKIGDQQVLIVPSSEESEEVEKNLLPLISKLSVCKLKYNGDTDSYMRMCSDICAKEPAFRNETLMLFQDQADHGSIFIVGPREECKKAKAYIEKELIEKEKAYKEVHSTSPGFMNVLLDSLDMLILEHTLALDVMKAKSSSVILKFHREKKCLEVTGPHHSTTDACNSIRALLQQHKDSHVILKDPAIYIKLLQKADVQRYLNEQLKTKDTACYWFPHDNEIHIFAASKERSQHCSSVLNECLKTKQVPLDDNIESILDTECSEFGNKMVWEKGKGKDESSVAILASTNDIFKQLMDHLRNKYKESKMEEKEIFSDNLNWEFCKEIFREELDHLQQKVTLEHKGDRLLISGVKSNVLEADKKIRELLDNIHKREMFLYGEEEISRLQKRRKVGGETVEKTKEAGVLMSISDPKTVIDPLKDVEYGNGKQWIFADGRTVVIQLAKWQDCDAEIVISFQQETKEHSGHSAFNFEEGKNDGRKVLNLYLPPLGEGRNNQAKKLEETMIIISQEMKGRTLRSLGVPLDQIHLVRWKGKFLMKRILHCFTEEKDFLNVSKLFFTHQSMMDLQTYRMAIQAAIEECTYQTDFHSERNFTLEVRDGSLVDTKVDVLVNTTDTSMNLEQGAVSKQILNKCGDELKEECTKHRGKQLDYGEVVVTGAGKGRKYGWKKILHGALPPWTGSENISILVHFVAECLRHASDLGLQSIAFPAIGTGKLGYPKNVAAKAIMTGILDYRKAYPQKSPRQILLTVFEKMDIQTFKDELTSRKTKVTDVGGCISFSIRPSLHLILTQTDIRVHAVDCLLVFWTKSEIYSTDALNKGYFRETGQNALKKFRDLRSTSKGLQCRTTDLCVPFGRIIHQVIDDVSDMTGTVVKGLSEACRHGCRRAGIVISLKDQMSSQLQNWSCAIYAGASRLAEQQPAVTITEIVVSCENFLFSKSVYHISQRHAKGNQTSLEQTSNNTQELCCEIRILGTSEDAVDEKENQLRALINQTEHEKASFKKSEAAESTDENSNAYVNKTIETSFSRTPETSFSRTPETSFSRTPETSDNRTPETSDNRTPETSVTRTLEASVKKTPESSGESRNSSRKELVLTEEEKCCLIIHCKVGSSHGQDNKVQKRQLEKQLSKYRKFSRLIYPFLDTRTGLLKCSTPDDAQTVLQEVKEVEMFTVKAFPPQAVNNIEAKLSTDVQKLLEKICVTDIEIEENTGASVQKNKTWVLKGNLLEIKAAEKYIKDCIQNDQTSARARDQEMESEDQPTKSKSIEGGARRKCYARCSMEEKECLYHFFPRDWDGKIWFKENVEIDEVTFSGEYNVINDLNVRLKEIDDFHREVLKDLNPHELETFGTNFDRLHFKKEDVMIRLDKGKKRAVIIGRTQETAALAKKRMTEMLKENKPVLTSHYHQSQQSNQNQGVMIPEQNKTVFLSEEDFHFLKLMKKSMPWKVFKPSEKGKEVQLSIPNSLMNSFESAREEMEALISTSITLQGPMHVKIVECISQLEADNFGIYSRTEPDRIVIKGIGNDIVVEAKEKIERVLNREEPWKVQGGGKSKHLYPIDSLEEMKNKSGADLAQSQQKRNIASQEYLIVKPPKGAKMKLNINCGLSVNVYNGDICYLNVDCIVNPTDETLNLRFGVSAYIMKMAGKNVSMECQQYIKTNTQLQFKTIFTSSGGSLNYHKILHVVCPKWIFYTCMQTKEDIRLCEEDLKSIFTEIIKTADRSYTSVGIPAIGAGDVAGIPKVLCVNSYAKSIEEILKTKKQFKNLHEVHIVDSKDDMVHLIRVAFQGAPIPWVYRRLNGDGQISLCSDLKVHIYHGFFVKTDAQAVAVSEGKEFNGKRWAVGQLLDHGGQAYQESHLKLQVEMFPRGNKYVKVCEGKYKFSFKKVLHVILPSWKHNQGAMSEYRKAIKELLSTAEHRKVQSLAMPFLGGGSDDQTHQKNCAAVLAEEFLTFSEKNKAACLTDIHIVNKDSSGSSGNSNYNQLLIGEFQSKILLKFRSDNSLQKYLTVDEPEIPGQTRQVNQNGAKQQVTPV